MYYSNSMFAVFLTPVVLFNGELSSLSHRLAGGGEEVRVFVVGCAITGIFGFMLGVANLLSIKVTSPVTHMVSSVGSRLCILPKVLTIFVSTRLREASSKLSLEFISSGMLSQRAYHPPGRYTWINPNAIIFIFRYRACSIVIITAGALFYSWVQSQRPPPPKHEAIPLPSSDIEKGGKE